jgi:murein DD-endopeptidase MepM/ murein hydrolase activator NlpD
VIPGSSVASAAVPGSIPSIDLPLATPAPPDGATGPLGAAAPPLLGSGSAGTSGTYFGGTAGGAGPVLDGAQALAALGDVTASLPGSGSSSGSGASDRRPGPNDNAGSSSQAQVFTYQQAVMTAQTEALNASQDAIDAVYAGGGSGKFGWPESYRTISQPYGCTNVHQAPTDSQCPSGHFHTGIDIAGPNLTDVYAADTGVARVFHGTTGYGNYVIITHGNGYSSLYGHLNDITVKDGQTVQRGDPIAHEGTTGNSTGPHLHFEIRFLGNYQNPCPFLENCHD